MSQMLKTTDLRPLPGKELTEDMQMVREIPSSMPKPDLSFRGQAPTDTYMYKTRDNKLVGIVARYETGGKKSFMQFTVWQTQQGTMHWYSKGIQEDRPLFELPWLINQPEAPVIITEGEKCAIIAARTFTDYVCITSLGGSGAISKTDFSPLAGRDVIIMPDNDAPGEKAAERFASQLRDAGAARICLFNIASLAEAFAKNADQKGFDIADAIEAGFNADDLQAALKNPAMVSDVSADISSLPDDPILRGLLTNFQLLPDLPHEFELNENGIFKTEMDKKGNVEAIFVGSPLAVLGRTRLAGGNGGWGYLVAMTTPDGEWIP